MNLEQQIMAKLKEAMKNKDTIALESLRAIKSELLLLKTASVGAEVDQNQEIALLQKLVKQRKEAAEQFTNFDRPDAAQKELAQANIIQSFLPKQLTEDELIAKLQEIIAQVGAQSPKDIGKVMGVATKELAGKAEGKLISANVKKLLS